MRTISTIYWLCNGIGVMSEKLEPYLDTERCIELIKKQTNNEIIPDENEFCVDDYSYGQVFENVADVLCHCDETSTLSWDKDGDGGHYLLYKPSYPWERVENEPNSIEDVHEIIKNAVEKLCNLKREQIEAMICDDIYQVGCG